MDVMPAVTLNLTSEERTVLGQVLEAEQARLLVEIRHTDHRAYRDEVRRKLAVVERLLGENQATGAV
jgi:hypothetical protein